MKVLALTRTSSIGPSTRYRIEQYAPLLAERGVVIETRPLFGRTWFRILEIRSAPVRGLAKGMYSVLRLCARVFQALQADRSDADLVLVEQQLFPYLPRAIELAIWPRRKPTILEFDDAIYLTFAHEHKLRALCARADLVIVGNAFLKTFAERTARQVSIIPTTVDPDRYARARRLQEARRAMWVGPESGSRPGAFRIGWIGLRYNFPFLNVLARPLADLSDGLLPTELRIISSGIPDATPEWAPVALVHRPWATATEAEEIAACDVGVMPVPDSDWSRGKCGLKLLQYMAAGVPVVCSPVGVNREIVRHGENGLLADTPDEWRRALRRLRDDPSLRVRLGDAGWQTVRTHFSIEGGARMIEESYLLALGPKRESPPS